MAVNKAIIMGNLGKDPEVRLMPNGNAVANFTVATSEQWLDANKQKQERTEWHNIVVYGKLAELCETYIHKGSKVYLEGKVTTRSYEDKQGKEVHRTEIIADTVQFLSRD